jgi:hypothetical protein
MACRFDRRSEPLLSHCSAPLLSAGSPAVRPRWRQIGPFRADRVTAVAVTLVYQIDQGFTRLLWVNG